MNSQKTFEIRTHGRATIEVTEQVVDIVRAANVSCGIANIFTQHTSCSLTITENADPAVQRDLEVLAQRWAPDGDEAYRHDTEGDDDMAAHARSVLTGCSLSIPIQDGRLALGTWQGIFLWEHRTAPHTRRIIVTVIG